jgi:hypothetical protein
MVMYRKVYVRCRVCGKLYKSVNNAHARMHGYDGLTPVEDYKREFGLEKATSALTRQRIGDHKVGNDYWVGRKHKKQTKEKLAKVKTGVRYSKETRKKLSEQRVGNKYALGYKHKSGFKRWISEHNKQWWAEKKSKYGEVTQGGKPLI